LKAFFKYIFLFFILIFAWGVSRKIEAVGLLKKATLYDKLTPRFAKSDTTQPQDTTSPAGNDSLPYPFPEESGFPFPNSNLTSPLYLTSPSNVENDVEYDPETGNYIFYNKIGENRVYPPVRVMSFDEYRNFDIDNALKKYWHMKARNATYEGHSSLIPSLHLGGQAFQSIFGSNTVSIVPTGSAELSFGMMINVNRNPQLDKKRQVVSTFDFQEKIQMNVTGQIGSKLRVNAQYDTEASFDFENKMKIAYQGDEDEIIQEIEAGNVSLPLTGSLITGSQTLFGIKTKLKFGHLDVTSIFSQQKGKSQVIEVEGGAQKQEFQIQADEYEANKHFFLSHFFRDHYEEWLKNLPVVTSPIRITKVEVWVTNKTGQYENARNIVALMDLGEVKPENINNPEVVHVLPGYDMEIPSDSANNLLTIKSDSLIRSLNTVSQYLEGIGLVGSSDFEKVESARKLSPSEYTVNDKLGYISLNSALNSDEVLAVAFQYTYNGKTYQVGEFSTDGINAPNNLVVKLLKGTSFTPKRPNWDLMMKNIYSLNSYQVNPDGFILDIYYQNDETGTAVEFLSDAGAISGERLLKVLNLDNIDDQQQRVSDGKFDYIEGYTIMSSNGKIIFPELEPFGSYLKQKIIGNNPADSTIAEKYVFQELYDSTQYIAQQIADKNKFFLKGEYRSASGSEISLNAINIPPGSVKVMANGQELTENVDYVVDYNIGKVTILNQGLLQSGVPIKISLESNTMFSIQSKTLVGTHLDYNVSKDFRLGATVLNLTEKPLTQKVNIGDEPISNTIWGLDGTYRTDSRLLTKIIDKLPFIDTKEMSNITISGEFAQLIPGHNKAIDKNGNAYIDDFEGSQTGIDLMMNTAWHLSSVPQNNPEVPEGNSYYYETNFNRARINWFTVDYSLVTTNSQTPDYLKNNEQEQKNHFVRIVYKKEIYPNKQLRTDEAPELRTLDVVFDPKHRGPYNFDVRPTAYSAGLNADGTLKEPKTRWGGIMRALTTNDFEAANIEYIDFWMMDPFVYDSTSTGGNMYIDLGDISEDILKDSRKQFEQGLPGSATPTNVDTTIWGRVPIIQAITNNFSDNTDARQYQDVGLDGLSDEDERSFYGGGYNLDYLDSIKTYLGQNTQAYQLAYQDPAGDDFVHFRDDTYDQEHAHIIDRYQYYNNPEGNSKPNTQDIYSSLPDKEDINNDNTLSEAENYFEYKLHISPEDMEVGKNFITDITESDETDADGKKVKWYHFRIPIYQPTRVVGQISDFKSIRFMRIFYKGFDRRTVFRFGTLQLMRNEWRKYRLPLMEGNMYEPEETGNVAFEVGAVNIEENANKEPVNYVLPPGVTRMIDPTSPGLRNLNEQALLLRVINLPDGDAKAVYKSVNLDVRKYKRIKMFIHAEALPYSDTPVNDRDLCVFVRLGSDFKDNYYEYEVPVYLTPFGSYDNNSEDDRYVVWPTANEIDLPFEELLSAKQQRNNALLHSNTVSLTTPYYVDEADGRRITIVGNPNISNLKVIMIGVRNRNKTKNPLPDDGLPKSAEIWVNELRLTDFDEKGGWAATARISTKLADLGNFSVSGMTVKPGFGSIEKKLSERSKEDMYQYNISTNLQLGKFFPEKINVKLPMFFSTSEMISNPQYNPLDPDIPTDVSLKNLNPQQRDSVRHIIQSYTKRRSLNFTNIQIGKMPKKPRLWSPTNWSATYSYNEIFMRDINIEHNISKNYNAILAYNFNNNPKNYAPFRRSKSRLLRSKYLRFIKDFNFYLMPQTISFTTDVQRTYNEVLRRNLTPEFSLPMIPTFNKNYFWNKNFTLRHKFTRTLTLDFNSRSNAIIGEPQGLVDNKTLRDSLFDALLGKGGRMNNYQHNVNVNYALPINKLPYLNWVSATVGYGGRYEWVASPIISTNPNDTDFVNPGNTITNGNTKHVNVNLNMLSLYNNVKYLKRLQQKYRNPRRRNRRIKVFFPDKKEEPLYMNFKKGKPKSIYHKLKTVDVEIIVTDSTGKKINGKTKIINKNRLVFIPDTTVKHARVQIQGTKEDVDPLWKQIMERTLLALMGTKNIRATYSVSEATSVPGYKYRADIVGMQKIFNGNYAPGEQFILGWQEDINSLLDRATHEEWLVKDTLLIHNIGHTDNKNLDLKASIEPFKGVRVDLSANRTMSHSQTVQLYYLYDQDEFNPMNSADRGNFSMSFNMIRTAFSSIKTSSMAGANSSATGESELFNRFLDKRLEVAKAMAYNRAHNLSTYSVSYNQDPSSQNYGYPDGYGPYQQDVMVATFLAVYSGNNPTKFANNKDFFLSIPYPNWRVNITGLTNYSLIKHYFRTLTITHAYTSTFSINSFTTNLNFQPIDENHDNFSEVRDMVGNFYPKYDFMGVVLDERFSPLFNIDATMNNSLLARIEVKKARQVALNVSNGQINETQNTEYTVGSGYRIKNLKITVKSKSWNKTFNSDLDLRLDLSMRKQLNIINRIEDRLTQVTTGMIIYTIKFTADYALGPRFTLRLFYDHNINKSVVGYPYTNAQARFGVSVRFSLAQ
jgi:cell surface protein SprA